ncbi:uncharacterized protein LOC113662967 isoform X3 [Tachysurus fulvidraco]|uniref:uncharacterized protein LOC113662967 isoform X3 n=1 Tax=Tachysurus fulvidraco TaxID=1234273 RepID=UPI001FEE97C4|nr:uncharacterized protein LOC113662967 isoform X3 [Tachysurus fulvidraco]
MATLSNRFAVLENLQADGVENAIQTSHIVLNKQYFKLIQITHHIQIISHAIHTDAFPKGMSKQVNRLTKFIKPACPNNVVLQYVADNTNQWMRRNMRLLLDHYTVTQSSLLTNIKEWLDSAWEQVLMAVSSGTSALTSVQTLPNVDLDRSEHAGFSCEPSSRISTNLIPQVHSTVVDVSFCKAKPVTVEAEMHHLPTEDLIQLCDTPDRTLVLGDKIVSHYQQSCDIVFSNVAVPISQTILPCTPNSDSVKEADSGSGKEAVMKDIIKDS